jgi:transcriptional regulator with XRE-family HTH domain
MKWDGEAILERMEWLRENIKKQSQRQVAASLGWKGTGYADIAKGRKRLTAQAAVELASYFGVPVEYLLCADTFRLPAHIAKAIEAEKQQRDRILGV